MKSTHSITIDNEIWSEFQKVAEKDYRSASNLIQMLMEKYIRETRRKQKNNPSPPDEL